MSDQPIRPLPIVLPPRLALVMRRATDPVRCRAALAQMYGYWDWDA